jgi:capsular polysaccharide biosynthesis protein
MSTPQKSLDPEAEQEVDFGRYVRLVAARWWLVVAGLILGAVIGYAVALGGGQRYQATATLYLGQPYSASGNVQLQAAQTNPSTVRVLAHARLVIAAVAARCKTKPAAIAGGISTQTVSGNLSKNGQTPLVSLSVQAAAPKVASCAANALAKAVITKISAFADQKIANFDAQIVNFNKEIATINQALRSTKLAVTDKLVLQLRLSTAEDTRLSTAQLLQVASQIEKPNVLVGAAAQRITARSRRNTAVVAAVVGAILGALAAILWDGLAASTQRRRTV